MPIPISNPNHSHSESISSQQHPAAFKSRRHFGFPCGFPASGCHRISPHVLAIVCRSAGPLGSVDDDKLEMLDLACCRETAPHVQHRLARLQAPCNETNAAVPRKGALEIHSWYLQLCTCMCCRDLGDRCRFWMILVRKPDNS